MARWRYASFVLVAAACGPVHQEVRPHDFAPAQLEKLDVYFATPGEFTVFEKRAGGDEGAGLMFGLIGAAIAESVDASQDEKTAEAVAATFSEAPTCQPGVERAFFETLEASGKIHPRRVDREPKSAPVEADAVIVLRIDHCGFRLMNQSSGEMAAFVEVGVKLTLADGTTRWDDRETVIATSRATAERLQSEEGLAAPLFEGVLADAGRRLANNLLYP